jgi:hypothetical protein
VVCCGVDGRLSGTEILNTRRVDAGDYPCNYSSSKLQSTVRNVLYFSFLLLRMLIREEERHMLQYTDSESQQLDFSQSCRASDGRAAQAQSAGSANPLTPPCRL